jgi:hypothetical protein
MMMNGVMKLRGVVMRLLKLIHIIGGQMVLISTMTRSFLQIRACDSPFTGILMPQTIKFNGVMSSY